MNKAETKTLLDLLSEMPDHRIGNAIRHKLSDIVAIGILAILCNADTFTGMQLFGEMHEDELRQILELPNGIPSHDVFGDVFSRLNLEAVEKCFQLWVEGMKEALNQQKQGETNTHVIAVDGKTIRRSQNAIHRASHIVTAYCSDMQLVLGQLCTEEKSNEITAIPKLLDMLMIRGSTVTIDAMGTQTAIAEKIISKEADYILALRENQPSLLEDIRFYAENEVLPQSKAALEVQGQYVCCIEKGHGRIDKRECWLIPDVTWLDGRERWKNLSGAAMIRSTRTLKNSDETTAERYYIYSRSGLTAKEFLTMQRSHWAIENNLHWSLDMQFHEDDAHVRMGHAAVVLNMLRKLVMQMLKADTSVKGSMVSKRLRCCWRFDYALSVLRNAGS